MGIFGDLFSTLKSKKKPGEEDEDYETNPDDNISEQDQLTLNKLIRERTKKGKRKMVEVEN
jgi:hypothetical protein